MAKKSAKKVQKKRGEGNTDKKSALKSAQNSAYIKGNPKNGRKECI